MFESTHAISSACVCLTPRHAQSSFGSNMCVLLLVCVGVYYWCTKHNEKCVYEDIARQQAESIAELDALRGMGDGRVTDYMMAMRRTSFKLDDVDAGVITYVSTNSLVGVRYCGCAT